MIAPMKEYPVIYVLPSEETELIVAALGKTLLGQRADIRQLEPGRIQGQGAPGELFYEGGLDAPRRAAMIWGSGEEHDKSLLLSPSRPFYKSLADLHTDHVEFIDPAKVRPTCASHNTVLLANNPYARGVEVKGPFDPERQSVSYDGEVRWFQAHGGRPTALRPLDGLDVHVSYDLDVVFAFPARYDWQNLHAPGQSLRTLQRDLGAICKANEVSRFDVGGLHLPRDHEILAYDGKVNPRTDARTLNEAVQAYVTLLDIFFSAGEN